MRLLQVHNFQLKDFADESRIEPYAILSHTWLRQDYGEGAEVLFADMHDLSKAREKAGWKKVAFATTQAINDGLEYVWIDTCCIDKSSSAELSESINSMYRWYQNSKVCYVYLYDLAPTTAVEQSLESVAPSSDFPPTPLPKSVDDARLPNKSLMDFPKTRGKATCQEIDHSLAEPFTSNALGTREHMPVPVRGNSAIPGVNGSESPDGLPFGQTLGLPESFSQHLADCRWFGRGWTLQEMIASTRVDFYNRDGHYLGALSELAEPVANITGVSPDLLKGNRPLASFSISQRMSWASKRQTSRIEDRAYSLLGIFDVSLPIIYGEGERAFQRLQEEILRIHSDHTIFAWGYRYTLPESLRRASPEPLLARTPDDFRDVHCRKTVPVRRNQTQNEYEILGRCINFDLPIFNAKKGSDLTEDNHWAAVLNCSFEDRPTEYVLLQLRRTSTGNFQRLYLYACDVYDAAVRCQVRSITILRHPDEGWQSVGQHDTHERFVLRCKHTKSRDDTLAFTSVEARIVMNNSRDDVESSYLSGNVWDEGTQCLLVPRRHIENHSADSNSVPFLLKAKVTLATRQSSSPTAATLVIYPFKDTDSEVPRWAFTRYSLVEIEFDSNRTHYRPGSHRHVGLLPNWRPLIISTKKKLIHDQLRLIEFAVGSRFQLPAVFLVAVMLHLAELFYNWFVAHRLDKRLQLAAATISFLGGPLVLMLAPIFWLSQSS